MLVCYITCINMLPSLPVSEGDKARRPCLRLRDNLNVMRRSLSQAERQLGLDEEGLSRCNINLMLHCNTSLM